MPSILTNDYRVNSAEQFKESFSETNKNYMYMAIGKIDAWADEAVPPAPTDDLEADIDIWNNLMSLKRINSNDVAFVIKRNTWATGTIYDAYSSSDVAIYDKTFYVINTNFRVYKCIYNNKGVASTIQPTGTNTSTVTTADGYVWKYMFTVTPADALKFTSTSWIAVRQLLSDDGTDQWTVQQAAVSGAIHVIDVTTGGSGYTTATVAVTGNGSGATATANLTGGVVTSITVNTIGSDYTNVTIAISGDGTGATATSHLAPKGGHGSNALYELYGFNIMLNTQFKLDESGDFTTLNDYRQITILKDMYLYGTTTIATSASTYTQYASLTLSANTGGYSLDEIVTGGTSGATAKVVDWNSGTGVLRILGMAGTFTNTETITGGTSGATATLDSQVTPEIEPYSGNLMYIDNRVKIQRDINQTEDVKLIITR